MPIPAPLMKTLRIIILGLFIFPSAPHAQAPGLAEIAGSMAVRDLVANIRNSLISISGKVSSDVSRNSFEVREHLALLTQLIDQLGQSLVGKTFDQLDQNQRKIFTNINNSVEQMQNAATITLTQVSNVVAQTNDAFGTLPFADRNPRVLRYGPAYIVGNAPNEKPKEDAVATINIAGSWLGLGEPKLAFNKTPCILQGKTETQLTFTCPESVFVSGSKVESITGLLSVNRPKGFWESVKNIFTEVPTDVTYKLAMFVVPKTMGTYKVSAVVGTLKVEEVIRQTQDFYHSNGHCEGPAHLTWTVNATPGWKIDVNSINVHENTMNGDSQNHGAFNRTENGFQLGGIVRNGGSCFLFVMDARGWLGVRATYREYRTVTGEALAGPWTGILTWGQDISVPLPSEAKSFKVEVTRLDGRILIDESAPKDREWHTVEYNPASRNLTVKAKPVTNAL